MLRLTLEHSTLVRDRAATTLLSLLACLHACPPRRAALTLVRFRPFPPQLAVNEFLNIMQSLLLPFAMLPALHFAAAPHILGGFRSPPSLMALTTCLALVVLFTNSIVIGGVIAALGFTLSRSLASASPAHSTLACASGWYGATSRLRVAHRTPPRQLLHLHTLQVRRLLLAPLRRSVRPPAAPRVGCRRAAAAYH